MILCACAGWCNSAFLRLLEDTFSLDAAYIIVDFFPYCCQQIGANFSLIYKGTNLLEILSSDVSAEGTMEAGSAFQSLNAARKILELYQCIILSFIGDFFPRLFEILHLCRNWIYISTKHTKCCHSKHNVRKRTFWYMLHTKTQTSLRMRTVWSIFVVRTKKMCSQNAPSEDSDQTARMLGLIWRQCYNVHNLGSHLSA